MTQGLSVVCLSWITFPGFPVKSVLASSAAVAIRNVATCNFKQQFLLTMERNTAPVQKMTAPTDCVFVHISKNSPTALF